MPASKSEGTRALAEVALAVVGNARQCSAQDAEVRLDLIDELRRAAHGNVARPLDDWHEDIGPVLWWCFPIAEPPYAGTPLDDDFPEYMTHWTTFAIPSAP